MSASLTSSDLGGSTVITGRNSARSRDHRFLLSPNGLFVCALVTWQCRSTCGRRGMLTWGTRKKFVFTGKTLFPKCIQFTYRETK